MPAKTDVPDAAGRFGPFGGRYVPETLTQALDQLTAEYERAAADAAFQDQLARLYRDYVGRPSPLYHAQRLSRQCGGAQIFLETRGPQPHRLAQDQQHARAGPLDAADGQAPRDRRDRGRTARRRHGHRLRPFRPRLRRLHGRRGHPPAAAERLQHEAPRGRGPARPQRLADPPRRHQRGLPRLDEHGREHALLPRLGRRPAPLPADRPRFPVDHRPGDARASVSNNWAGCRTWSSPAWAGGATPRACSIRWSATPAWN